MIITGNGKSGSWKIRGEQLGQCVGARIIPKCQEARGEAVYVIKRLPSAPCRGARIKIWDVVDAWPQPEGNAWKREKLIKNTKEEARRHGVTHIIAATKAMAEDLETPYWLYHHGRTYEKQNPIREHVKTVAYEGGAQYLGRWLPLIGEQCKKRGWNFIVNPDNLTNIDIILALRDFPYKGYATDHWKSNVKLANAQTSGTPVIVNRESGYKETTTGGEVWADTPEELIRGFDLLEAQSERLIRASMLRKGAYLVEDAARDLQEILYGKLGILNTP